MSSAVDLTDWEAVRQRRRAVKARLVILGLDVFLIVIGYESLRHPFAGFVSGIFGTFLIIVGGQVLLWIVGVRSELLGTVSDVDVPSMVQPFDPEMEMQRKAENRRLLELEMIEFTTANLERQVQTLELQAKIEELEAKIRSLRQNRGEREEGRGGRHHTP
jgi:hypothetical protein